MYSNLEKFDPMSRTFYTPSNPLNSPYRPIVGGAYDDPPGCREPAVGRGSRRIIKGILLDKASNFLYIFLILISYGIPG